MFLFFLVSAEFVNLWLVLASMYLEIVNSVYALHKWRSWRTCESGCLCTSVFVLLLLLALMPILDLRFMLPKLSLLPLENHPLPVHVYYRCPPSHLSVGVTFFFFFLLFRFASFFPYANSHQVHQEVPIQKKMESVFLVPFLLPFSELF